MVAVLQFQENLAHIGLSTRRAKLGPELDLVQRFTDYVIAAHQPKTLDLGIFYEPFLDSGFPDMVMVEYDTRVFEHWSHSRFLLRPIDLKVLHHLHHVKRASTESIKALLGMNAGDLLKTLELL